MLDIQSIFRYYIHIVILALTLFDSHNFLDK